MPDSPPLTPPQQNESHESDTQQNPNSVTDSEAPDTQNLPSETQIGDQNHPEIAVDDELQHDDPDPENENPESEGMNITHSPISHSTMVSETHNVGQGIKGCNNNPAVSVRRTMKRKKAGKNRANQVALERKTQQLLQEFNPIPFVPGKILDFSKYEEFLKLLGLWDFAHVEFDRNFRVDLIGKLILGYSLKLRGSYVNDFKIGVSRAHLGRALKLPVKKVDCDVDEFPQDFLSFLEEFVSNWMLLHEDLWCTPNEIVTWMKMIKDGNPHKVDWAGLIWYMVEKELAQRQSLKDCYYAAHLQLLIKTQKEELFLDNPDVGLELPKVEVENSKEAVMVDDDEDVDDVKMMEVEESGSKGRKLEEQNVELRLGHDSVSQLEKENDGDGDADNVEKDGDKCPLVEMEKAEDVKPKKEDDVGNAMSVDEDNKIENVENSEHGDDIINAETPRTENKDSDMMDFGGDYKEEEENQGQWYLNGKLVGHHYMQRCSVEEMKVSEDRRHEGVDVGEEDEHVEGFKIMPKNQLDGMSSANLMQAFGTGQLPYSSTEIGGQSSLELMSSRADDNMMLGGPSMFNHAGKREIDHGNDISHHGLNDNQKRTRVDESWDDKPHELGFCLDQILQWAEKAKIRQMADVDDTYQQASMAQHIYSQQLTQKESELVQLRYKLDDLQRSKQVEVDRLNRELYLMNSVVDGYRRALKQTQKTFAEYRKRCRIPDEPVYKDAGLGGVVKSVTELERERLKKEEESKLMRNYIEETFREHLNDCEVKWESEVLVKVQFHHSRLMDAVKEVELLRDHHVNRKTSTDVQNETQGPS
ncbi:Sec-independent protein translocase protein TatA [Bienertia sinuspersici]